MTESMSQRCNCCSSSSYSTAFHRKKKGISFVGYKNAAATFWMYPAQTASKQAKIAIQTYAGRLFMNLVHGMIRRTERIHTVLSLVISLNYQDSIS